jgi:hypothetical protein
VRDPGADTVTQYIVDWGDGTRPDVYAQGGDKTHTYETAGLTPTLRVTLVDEDGTYPDVARKALQVLSGGTGAPEITSLTLDQPVIPENSTVTLTGGFTQTGGAVAHTVTVDEDTFSVGQSHGVGPAHGASARASRPAAPRIRPARPVPARRGRCGRLRRTGARPGRAG